METNIAHNIRTIVKDNYVVPLYQRNFAWGETEIHQLIQDIYSAYKRENSLHYFIGSLITIRRNDGIFEVIDGQQRITMMSILLKYLCPAEFTKPFIHFDSRESVDIFFDNYYNEKPFDDASNGMLCNYLEAIEHIQNCPIIPNAAETIEMLRNNNPDIFHSFAQFVLNQVMLVRVEMPEDTDVAAYFEVMNNRGLQLQKHEILKSLLIGTLPEYHQYAFSMIWDACSQMDVRIQRSLKKIRAELFGTDYDTLNLDVLNAIEHDTIICQDSNIEQILSAPIYPIPIEDDAEEDISTNIIEKSIIDFPNFLMHIFSLVYPQDNIPLDEKHLLSVYADHKNQLDSWLFLKYLLYYRTIFDRYIIRSSVVNEEENTTETDDNEKWSLKKPHSYPYKGKSTLKFKDSFTGDPQAASIEKALSLLQVVHRNRKNKTYLKKILLWFPFDSGLEVSAVDYLHRLNGLILDEYQHWITDEDTNLVEEINPNTPLCLGVGTPHFVLNFIDYLYWTAWTNKTSLSKPLMDEIKYVTDFDYKYWNSVEHHMPQSYHTRIMQVDSNIIDNLGNLCMVGKNLNSKMNDRSPKEKADTYWTNNLAPNRRIIYSLTKKMKKWTEQEIWAHYLCIAELLERRNEILQFGQLSDNDLSVIRAIMSVRNVVVRDGWSLGYEKFNFMNAKKHPQFAESKKELERWCRIHPTNSIEDYIKLQLSSKKFEDKNQWRELFVRYPKVLSHCRNGKFTKDENNHLIYLLRYDRESYERRELCSFILRYYLLPYGDQMDIDTDGMWIPLCNLCTFFKGKDDAFLYVTHNHNHQWEYVLHAPYMTHLRDLGWIPNPSKKSDYTLSDSGLLVSDTSLPLIDSINQAKERIIEIINKLKLL